MLRRRTGLQDSATKCVFLLSRIISQRLLVIKELTIVFFGIHFTPPLLFREQIAKQMIGSLKQNRMTTWQLILSRSVASRKRREFWLIEKINSKIWLVSTFVFDICSKKKKKLERLRNGILWHCVIFPGRKWSPCGNYTRLSKNIFGWKAYQSNVKALLMSKHAFLVYLLLLFYTNLKSWK